jgi:citrate synthase
MGSGNGMAGGLDGVVVADTRLSEVDGERGRLIVGGFDVEELAGRVGFEHVVGLLFDGVTPGEARRRAIAEGLAEGRALGYRTLARAGDALEADDAMDALRTAASHLPVDGDSGPSPRRGHGAGRGSPSWCPRPSARTPTTSFACSTASPATRRAWRRSTRTS